MTNGSKTLFGFSITLFMSLILLLIRRQQQISLDSNRLSHRVGPMNVNPTIKKMVLYLPTVQIFSAIGPTLSGTFQYWIRTNLDSCNNFFIWNVNSEIKRKIRLGSSEFAEFAEFVEFVEFSNSHQKFKLFFRIHATYSSK